MALVPPSSRGVSQLTYDPVNNLLSSVIPLQIDLRATGRTSPCLALYPAEDDGLGNVLQANAASGVAVGKLPNIHLTDPSSPGSARYGYGFMSSITSSFDPVAGQAVFKVTHGDAGFTGDLLLIGTTRLLKDGTLVINQHSAPADASLNAGDCALWFDQTDGAGNTKLMVKGKSANGTVKTATILLA